ncbi:hypothetical protein BN874_2560001 [Candidatus Contendobacter odensis Run_B_J11]|uniref:Uncharacterized protein n=1 Tax=Candidatus Contendobacter odensis Run_B_J11 TaxID=1400861 RepID=A0A7U7GCC2_9GAMM|nr:hypothetical protein BN874_2560001 [Candidatus Contendobacter odensis Run_B_J11]
METEFSDRLLHSSAITECEITNRPVKRAAINLIGIVILCVIEIVVLLNNAYFKLASNDPGAYHLFTPCSCPTVGVQQVSGVGVAPHHLSVLGKI